jgi:hypothetical protein
VNEKRKNDAGFFARMNEKKKQRSRMVAFVIFGGVAAMTIIGVVIGFIIATIESAEVRSTYGETIAGMCEDLPMGAASLANLPAVDEPPTRLLLLRTNSGQRHRWHSQLPIGWRAETAEEVGMVGCVLIDDNEIESCDYSRIGAEQDLYTVSIERMQTTASITLLNPTTGERVAERTVNGSEPDPCPPDSEDLNIAQQLEGSEPTAADFQDWLEQFVDDTAG